jgi:putative ABC transport system permease protein
VSIDRWLHVALMRLRSLFGSGRLDRDLDDELRFHIERQTEANVARGLPPEVARRQAVPAMRVALSAVDRDQPATSIALMGDVMASATAEPAFYARLLGGFAVMAMALALVGTYGVLAYAVALRTHEIGVRLALGADARSILWLVIRRTVLLAAAGVALGIFGASFTTGLLTAFLFETTPTDLPTFVTVTLAIFTAAVLAGFVPARRATQVDPLVALRHE